jgi:hypothetical protein
MLRKQTYLQFDLSDVARHWADNLMPALTRANAIHGCIPADAS